MSKEDFQSQLSTVMDGALRTAVSETTKLVESLVEELKAEICRIKSENQDLKSRFRCHDQNGDDSFHCGLNDGETAQNISRPPINKRDVGIQCALLSLRDVAEHCGCGGRGAGEDQEDQEDQDTHGHSNHQVAFIFIKQEETEYDNEYAPGYILLKQEDGPPTLIRRPDPHEIPALLPSTISSLVGCNIPEWPPAVQPSEVMSPPGEASESQEAPQTTSLTRSPIPRQTTKDQDGDLDQASGAKQQPGGGEPERAETFQIQEQPQPSAVEEQQQPTEATGNQATVAQQRPVAASPGKTQPRAVAEETQEVIPSGIEQLLAFAEEQQQQQQDLLQQQQHSAVGHPSVKPSTLPPTTSAEPEHFGIVDLLKLAEQHPQSGGTPSVSDTVDPSSRQTGDVATTQQQPPNIRPALPSNTSTSVSEELHTLTHVDNPSSLATATRRSYRPLQTQAASAALTSTQPSKALQHPPTSPPRQVLVTRQTRAHRQQPSTVVQTRVESPRQPADAVRQTTVRTLGRQAVGQTVSSPGQVAMVTSQTTPMSQASVVGKRICPPRKPSMSKAQTKIRSPKRTAVTTAQTAAGSPGRLAIAVAQTVLSPKQHACTVGQTAVGSPRQQNTVTGETAVGSPKQQPLPARIIVVSPKYRSMVTSQTTTASSMHTSTVVTQIAAASSRQQQGVPQRIVVLSPRHQSLVTGQLNEHAQPAVGVASGQQPTVTSRAVTVVTPSPLVVAASSTSSAEPPAAVPLSALKSPHLSTDHVQTPQAPSTMPSATSKKLSVALMRLTNFVSKETTPEPPSHMSKNQFLAQLAVLPVVQPPTPDSGSAPAVSTPPTDPAQSPASVSPVSTPATDPAQSPASVSPVSTPASAPVPTPTSAPISGPVPTSAPIPVPDPLQMDSEDVGKVSPLPAVPTETPDTRTVATETNPIDTKEGALRPSDNVKESLFARLKARLRPRRPQPSVTETDSSPTTPKKPRMSKAANQPKDTSNAAGQSGRANRAVTPPRHVESYKSSTPMKTRGRSTAQLEKAPESTSKTTTPQRSPINSSSSSGPLPHHSPSTPPRTTSRIKRPPPSPRSLTIRSATLRHIAAAKTPPQPHTPDKEPPQDESNSPSQPLQRIGNRLLKNQCGACGRILSSTAALESHVSQHTGDRPFFCTFCGKGFPDAKGLNRHGRVHSGDSHECPQCQKTFTYRFGLNKHLQMVHGQLRPFSCQVCSKGFFTQRDVEAHLRVHTGEKPFHCTLCEKKFKRKVELNVHLRWHNGEKRHWCPFCGKGFLDFNNLKRHKLIHTGEKPHCCPQCEKTFTQSGHLKKHLKNVHRMGEGHEA